MTALTYNLNRFITLFLREKLSDPMTRGEWKTDSFTADGYTNSFTTVDVRVNSVKSVKVDDIPYVEYEDFEVTYGNSAQPATIMFLVTPKNNQTVAIEYHHGQTWIYPGFPRRDATFPRVGFKIIDDIQEEIGIGRHIAKLKEELSDEFSGTGSQSAFSVESTPLRKILRVQHPRGVYLDRKNFEYR
jgi:hypothetical protein